MQKRSEFIYYDEKQPYTEQWHVHFDRDLGHSIVAGVGYIGSKGHNLPFYGDPNTTPSEYVNGVKQLVPGATLRYPAWGRIRTRINVARSIYQGVTASVTKRYANNWQGQVSYTLRQRARQLVRRTDRRVGLRQRRGQRDRLVGIRTTSGVRRVMTSATRSSSMAPTSCRSSATNRVWLAHS